MTLTDLLLLVVPQRDNRAATGLAAKLAAQYGARVEGVCLAPLPALQPEDCFAEGRAAIHEVVARFEHETEAMAREAEEPVRAAIEAAGCSFAWTVTDPGELAAETALRCRLADLAVMSRPGVDETVLAEAVVRLGGAPCLVVPETCDPGRPLDHIVLAWNGSRQAKRAMDDAMPLLCDAKRVSILVMGSSKGLERQHEALLAHLHRKGAPAAMMVEPKRGLRATLLPWCADHEADLLVMGAFGHTPRAERWFGGTTSTVLTNAHLPVLLSC